MSDTSFKQATNTTSTLSPAATDFVNRNKPGFRADMRHLMTTFIDDIVDFADAHHVDRETTMLEVGQQLRMIPSYADLTRYRALPDDDDAQQDQGSCQKGSAR